MPRLRLLREHVGLLVNGYRRILVSGALVEVWGARCNDKGCGHISGLARVTFADGSGVLLSGASCRTDRRGPAEAEAWALAIVASRS